MPAAWIQALTDAPWGRCVGAVLIVLAIVVWMDAREHSAR